MQAEMESHSCVTAFNPQSSSNSNNNCKNSSNSHSNSSSNSNSNSNSNTNNNNSSRNIIAIVPKHHTSVGLKTTVMDKEMQVSTNAMRMLKMLRKYPQI